MPVLVEGAVSLSSWRVQQEEWRNKTYIPLLSVRDNLSLLLHSSLAFLSRAVNWSIISREQWLWFPRWLLERSELDGDRKDHYLIPLRSIPPNPRRDFTKDGRSNIPKLIPRCVFHSKKRMDATRVLAVDQPCCHLLLLDNFSPFILFLHTLVFRSFCFLGCLRKILVYLSEHMNHRSIGCLLTLRYGSKRTGNQRKMNINFDRFSNPIHHTSWTERALVNTTRWVIIMASPS